MSLQKLSLFDLYEEGISKVCDLEREVLPLVSTVVVDEFTDKAQENFDYAFDGTSKFYPFKMNSIIKNLDFQILAIVGASGSGKSTFSKYFGKQEKIEWNNDKAIISHFETPDEATEKLIASGISSIPTWCKPRNVLSVGEGFRADIARQLHDGCIIDEFTSNVDRNVALSCAKSVGDYIRKKNLKKCVFVSCHKDFIDTLCPDYVIDLDDECVYDTRRLPKRKFELSLFKSDGKEYVWKIFGKYHYMTQDLNKASTLYTLFYNNTIVACCYILPLPGAGIRNGWRIHRLVVHPDYQGMGIGTKFLNTLCDLYKYHNATLYLRTSHIKLRNYCRRRKDLFLETSGSGKNTKETCKELRLYNYYKDNVAYSFKYIGQCKYDENIKYDEVSIHQNSVDDKKEKSIVKKVNLFDF